MNDKNAAKFEVLDTNSVPAPEEVEESKDASVEEISKEPEAGDLTTLQRRLNEFGYKIPVDGANSVALRTAIKDFKTRNGLSPNREWDDKAQNKLDDIQRSPALNAVPIESAD